MFVFIRLYRFHRRCGMHRAYAIRRALGTVLRDINLRSPL
jgi:hypothetical protein